MWPVVVCGIAVAAIIAWRLAVLSVELGRARALLERVDDLVGRGMLAEALAAARATEDPAARVVTEGLSRRNAGPRRVAQAFRTAAVMEIARLERGFVPLAALATVAPLAGALATVLSMLESEGALSPVATLAPLAVGMVIALVASVVHMWLGGRVERFGRELRRSTAAGAHAIETLDSR